MPNFTFTRVPSTKVSVAVTLSGLVQADNELVIVGRRAATGGSATTGVPVQIENFGDPVAAAAECVTRFGTASEIQTMVVAAIEGVLFSNLDPKAFPTIKVIPIVSTAAAADLAATLAANIQLPMPFLVTPYAATDATARTAVKNHITAINASDRGLNAQFGSFAFMGSLDTLANSTAAGEAIAFNGICIPWLRDGGGTPANSLLKMTCAYAAVCASSGVPYLPLNDIKVGGLVAPAAAADWHTSGDAGTVALGLASGLVPLTVAPDGGILISRTITSVRTVNGVPDNAYYDMQDWQKLYFFRKNAYVLAQQPRYKRAHASDAKLLALKSELIKIAKDFEALEMFQYVDKLVQLFTVTRPLNNRFAGVYGVPVNVIPGFMNKGIALEGVTTFDSFAL